MQKRFMRKDDLTTLLCSKIQPGGLRYDKGKILLYALCDPRDRTVRYVGVTNDRDRRLAQHRSGEFGNLRLRRWLKELRIENTDVEMVTLGYTNGQMWETAERNWIAHMRKHHILYNLHRGGLVEFDQYGRVVHRKVSEKQNRQIKHIEHLSALRIRTDQKKSERKKLHTPEWIAERSRKKRMKKLHQLEKLQSKQHHIDRVQNDTKRVELLKQIKNTISFEDRDTHSTGPKL